MRYVARLGLVLIAGSAAAPACAADLRARSTPSPFVATGFLATCEDLGRFCFADACGRDQIEAVLACRARCPSSAVLGVAPAACPLPGPATSRSRRG